MNFIKLLVFSLTLLGSATTLPMQRTASMSLCEKARTVFSKPTISFTAGLTTGGILSAYAFYTALERKDRMINKLGVELVESESNRNRKLKRKLYSITKKLNQKNQEYDILLHDISQQEKPKLSTSLSDRDQLYITRQESAKLGNLNPEFSKEDCYNRHQDQPVC